MDLSQIAVVILNWNGQRLLEKFLPSVVVHSGNAAIYVADNHSSDNSVAFVLEHFPTVKLIVNQENGGYAKGYNDALKFVNEPIYVLLNSDIQVTENWLEPLFEAMQDEKIAAVQPKIKAYNKQSHFEYAGAVGGFIDMDFYPFCRGRIFDTIEEDQNQYDFPIDVFWVSGACMVIRKRVFWEVGGLDEDFFAHMEEIDLCWRAKKRGYTMLAVPTSTVYHVGGGTLDYNSPRKTFLNFRNSLLMITKNYSGWLFGTILYRLILDGIAGTVFMCRLKPKLTLAIVKAHFSYYGLLGKMLAKREKNTDFIAFKYIKGVYRGSILWAFHIKGTKVFSKLNLRKFDE